MERDQERSVSKLQKNSFQRKIQDLLEIKTNFYWLIRRTKYYQNQGV